MAKNFTKILCAFLAFVMCLGTVPAFAIEADLEALAEERALYPIKKTANGLDANDQTDVSLTVPGTIEGSIDVVIIMGDAMAGYAEIVAQMIELFKPIMEDEDPNTNIKLGMVALGKSEFNVLDVNSNDAILSNDENDDNYYINVLKKVSDINYNLPAGPTNLEGAMRVAEDMLARDNSVKAENKYVFVMSTGRTYWFNETDDATGDSVMVVHKEGNGYYWGDYQWRQDRGRHTSLYMIPDTYNNSYADFFEDIKDWVEKDGDKYLYKMPEGTTYSEWTKKNQSRNAISPVPTNANSVTGVMAAVPLASPSYKTQHALSYERAQYEAIKAYGDLIDAGYRCYAICSETPNYQNNSKYYHEVKSAAGGAVDNTQIQVGHAFMDYLAQMSGQEYAPLVWEYDLDANGNIQFYPGKEDNWNYALTKMIKNENGEYDFFASLKKDIIYTTSKNTTVVDYIGKNENGNFEFIEKAEYIKLVVGGVEYITKMTEDTEEGSKYTFTAPGATEYTFTLNYFYGNGETTEYFEWWFGENVSLERLATLTYKLQLTEKKEAEGTYTVPTNNSATLYPVDSNGNDGEPQLFPVPTVEYTVTPYDVDIVIALGAGIAKYDNDYKSNDGTEYHNTYDSIISLVEPLINQGITVKLGLVAVEHYDDVAMELTALDADNYESIIQSGLETIQNMPAGPTNLHGNIEAAKAMLDADKTVPAANKFFYVIATGRTYNYDNEQGVPTTIVNKIKLKGDTYYYWGHYLWQSQRGRHTSLYMIPDRYNNDFAAYWADVEKWVKADGDTYAYSFTDAYNVNDPQWFNTFFNANNKDAKALGLASSRFGWIMNPLTNTDHAGISDAVNPNHALSYERAQYEAYQTYQEMEAAGYNCYALCSESTSYQNNSPYIKVQKYTGTSIIQLGHSFMNFLAGEDQNYEAPLLFVMTDPNTGASDVATNFFAPVDTTKLVKSTTKALEFKGITYNIKVSYGTIAYITVEAEGDVTYEWHVKTSGGEEYVSAIDTETYKVVMDGTYDEQQVYCVITDELGNKKTTDTVTLILSH